MPYRRLKLETPMFESDLQSFLPSLEVVQTALSMQPDHPELINMRGTVYLQLHQPELALADFEHATRLAPEYATAYFNWATTLHALGQLESALVCFDHALRIAPQFMQAWSNKGNTLHALNRLDEAVYCYDQALSCDPDSADVRWNKAHSLLLQGKFEQGWPLYESRWQTQGFSPRPLASTLWLGEASLENASIFVHAEQGLGDTLQFLRYLEPLIETGARVTLEVAASLKPLAQKIQGLAHVIAAGESFAATDFHCPLMSLPLALKRYVPFVAQHQHLALQASASCLAQWENRLGARTQPRVGLVMQGNVHNEKDRLRSIAVQQWAAHLPSDLNIVLLHDQLPAEQLALISEQPNWRFVGEHIHNFEDTAALCQLMDVVVSVDTSVVHLSASLMRPTWLLLPHAPDWRWQLERSDSPWYPSMRLFRQSQPAHWDDVLLTLSQALRQLLVAE